MLGAPFFVKTMLLQAAHRLSKVQKGGHEVKRRWKFCFLAFVWAGVISFGTLSFAEKGPSIFNKVGKAAGAAIKAVKTEGHPEVSEQEKLTPCFECHKEATPDIEKEWYNSGHGIANVKCYQCHGTFENMKKVPSDDNCYVCHANAKNHTKPGKTCWACHPAHNFPVKKK